MIPELKKLFQISDESNFPVTECTEIGKEKGVKIGTSFYTCLIVDADFPGYYEIEHHCTPYIFEDEKGVYFGWLDKNERVLDNLYQSIHIDSRCVIGFRKECSEKEQIQKEWKTYKKFLDEQQED